MDCPISHVTFIVGLQIELSPFTRHGKMWRCRLHSSSVPAGLTVQSVPRSATLIFASLWLGLSDGELLRRHYHAHSYPGG